MFLKIKILIKPVLIEFSDEDRYYQQIPYSDCEAEFLNIFYDSDIKIDFEQYPGSIFVFKNDEFIFEYDIKYGILWCSYDKIWTIFLKKYELNDLQITNLIKNVVEGHFKNIKVTPTNSPLSTLFLVEEHFNNIEITPQRQEIRLLRQEEKHFKNREIKPSKWLILLYWWKNIFKKMEVKPKWTLINKPYSIEEHFKKKSKIIS